jgi:DNA replication and repair protein RecF
MITDIHLQNFRSYIDESFELQSGVNIIVGPNGSVKTNLLEAILVSSRGSSFRVKDIELIANNKPWSRIESNINNTNRIIKLEKLNEDKVNKTYEINTQKLKRLNLTQTIPTVLFEPNHLLLLIGSPELRRSYLDDILEQTVIGYKTTKNNYRRTLAQRNMLLKGNKPQSPEMFVWNVRLSEIGGKLIKERLKLVEDINKKLSDVYKLLSGGKEKLKVIYKTNISTDSYESNLLKKLEQTTDTDLIRGFTAHGPHRDDLVVEMNNKVAGETASRGETRSILLTLKMIETQMLEQARGEKPLLLFDDVFSELDGSRRLALTKILNGYQTIITTTDADVVVQHFMDKNNIIPLN